MAATDDGDRHLAVASLMPMPDDRPELPWRGEFTALDWYDFERYQAQDDAALREERDFDAD
jgi:hypothetical protein